MIKQVNIREGNGVTNLAFRYRQLFPIAQRYVYLNHASVSPLSSPVHDAMANMLKCVSEYADGKFEEWERGTMLARAAAAKLVNAQPHQIAFVRNTSEALSVIANGMKWHAGDNVVSAAAEFPANIYPWSRLKASGVELRLQPDCGGLVDIDALLSLVDERT